MEILSNNIGTGLIGAEQAPAVTPTVFTDVTTARRYAMCGPVAQAGRL
jgi:hypothetical protein